TRIARDRRSVPERRGRARQPKPATVACGGRAFPAATTKRNRRIPARGQPPTRPRAALDRHCWLVLRGEPAGRAGGSRRYFSPAALALFRVLRPVQLSLADQPS